METGDFEGIGKMTTDFETIEGNWRDSKLNGQAIRKCRNGDRYEGQWTDGMLNGEGSYHTKDCDYFGNF
jgi:hypothetical protein